jgi:hypothetical protein
LSLLILVIVGAGIFFMKKNDSSTISKPALVEGGLNSITSSKPIENNSADNSPPPWMGSGSGMSPNKNINGSTSSELSTPSLGAANPKLSGVEASQRRLVELEKIQAELNASLQNGQPDLKKLSATLNKMKQTQGDNVGGVNINALINNLEKAQQIQELALEMQKESAKTGNFDQKKLDSNMKKMLQLQSEMRVDIVTTTTTNKSK